MSDISPGSLLFIVITSIIGIFVISLGLRRKPSKGNNQYNLLHDVAQPNISVSKEKTNDFYKPSKSLSFPLSQLEVALLVLCLKYIRRLIKDTEAEKLSGLLNKISSEYNSHPNFPYDSLIELESEEIHLIDSALHLMMTDALMAKEFGDAADAYIDGKSISELASHVGLMRELLRRLHIGTEMQLLNYQISKLKEALEV